MSERLSVTKTHKLWVGGKFPRSESGRTLEVCDRKGNPLGLVAHASRKDLRDAVTAAADAREVWAGKSAYLRGQILYRMAEMLEGRGEEFAQLLASTVPGGIRRARRETTRSVDRLVAFAGWADKYSQVLGNQNPVAAPFYNFTVPEPTGIVGVIAPDDEPLLGLISLAAPALCSGNVVVALGSEAHPLATAVLGEVAAVSDFPDGSLNLLTGKRRELLEILAGYRSVDGIHAAGCSETEKRALELGSAENLKRVVARADGSVDWYDDSECQSPYWIESFVDFKTLWHPRAS